MTTPDILATRYATPQMAKIWSRENRVVTERALWIAVMEAQMDLGVDIPKKALIEYRRVSHLVNLERISLRETVTRHDVKARIEEFNQLAGFEYIHLGLTSHDMTENVDQILISNSALIVRDRIVAVLDRLGRLIYRYDQLAVVGRSHNVPAQVTTLGKRFATCANEMLLAFDRLEDFLDRYPAHGVKGPVGTASDQLDLMGGDLGKLGQLEDRVVEEHMDFSQAMVSVGQVYPRSLDLDLVSALVQVAAGPSSLATTIRLMAGHDLVSEGFQDGQVGSSAMPHKMNTRSCERVNGLTTVLRGFMVMVSELAGNQWNEGDVSCSVVRRVALPGAFYAIDGLFETFLTVLKEFTAFPAEIDRELNRYLPFLYTTQLLTLAVQRGVGREEAHRIIQDAAVTLAVKLRTGECADSSVLFHEIVSSNLPVTWADINEMKADTVGFIGAADYQCNVIRGRICEIVNAHPVAAIYTPSAIL